MTNEKLMLNVERRTYILRHPEFISGAQLYRRKAEGERLWVIDAEINSA